MKFVWSFYFALSIWSRLSYAQSSWISSDNYFRLYWHSSIVLGEYVYVLGGELESVVGGQHTSGEVNQTIVIPLSTSWTNSTVQIRATNLPSSFPHMKSPTLWLDATSNIVWFFNGETSFIYPQDADPLSIWTLKPDGNGGGTWKENNSPSDEIFNGLTRSYGCGSAYTHTAGYCLGGYSSLHTTPKYDGSGGSLALGGMQVFNFADKSWSNVSSVGSSASGWTMWPVFEYVPGYGRSGLLIVIGGDTPTDQNDGANSGAQEPLRPMSNITVYDVYNQQWYSQTATGDVPFGRIEPCFVGAQGGDNSTYEIFVFGGWVGKTGSSNSDSHQVYVLSLPAFRWFRATESTASRFGHTCNVVGNRQMLSIGGWDPTADGASTADTFTYGLGIFDMTKWTWTSGYVVDAKPYEPASQVSQFYSTNPKYPSWDNPALQAIIEANATSAANSTSTSPSSSTSSSSSSSTPTGAIAGGVVGGVAFLALVGALIWFCMRRRRRNRGDLSQQNNPTELSSDLKWPKPRQNPAELGPDRPHEMGPEMPRGELYGDGIGRGQGETGPFKPWNQDTSPRELPAY